MLSALISLEATIDDGKDYNTTYSSPGTVQVSDLSCYHFNHSCPGPVPVHARAHAYGEVTLALDCDIYDDIGEVLDSNVDRQYYCRSDNQEFAHRFYEYNKNDTQQSYPHFTQRVITASTGLCDEYIQDGEHTEAKIGNESAWHYRYKNKKDGSRDNITIPLGSVGNEGTTYIYREHGDPQTIAGTCGDRCLHMWAYKGWSANYSDGETFYRCPITVSNVTNSYQSAHDVPKRVAQVAAASIALQGQWHDIYERKTSYAQYQFYAGESVPSFID